MLTASRKRFSVTRLVFNYSDIDECQEQDVGCQHLCYDSQGSYSCGCFPGYALMEDEKSCNSKFSTFG